VNKRGGGDDFSLSPNRFYFSSTVNNLVTSMFSMNFFKLCRETKACFLVPVGQRDKDTLLPIIPAHILPGTRVISDMWKAYDCLKDEGYSHLTVNHSLNFVDPDTGGHTQRIENTWWGDRQSMPRKGTSKDLFESYLQEWLWRQHFGDDPFGNIIKHIADLYEVRIETPGL